MLVQESLNGGVVQTRHPTLLRPGEVQRADEMILRPGDPALQRAPGRSAYGTVRSTSLTATTTGDQFLNSASLFGTNITGCVRTAGSPFITKASAFGSVVEGQTIVGNGIPVGAVVRRVVDTSTLELSVNATTSSGSATITYTDLHPGTFISGTGIPVGTYIVSLTSAGTLTMSQNATNSTSITATFSEAVTGLSSLEFNSVSDFLLLAKAADKLYTSSLTGLTGTFAALVVGLTQSANAALRTIQYANKHVVITGFDTPRVVYYKDNAVRSRTLSMLPVKDFIGLATVAGSWSSLTSLQNGYYYFLVTEVFNPGSDDEVESTFTGDPKSVRITDYTTQAVKVTRATSTSDLYNNGLYGQNLATHWRVYMSPRQSDLTPAPDLSTFRAIGEPIPVSTTEITLSDTNPHQTGWAAVLATYGGYDGLFPNGSAGALSTTAKQSLSSTFSAGSNVLSSSALFGTVTKGMVITSPNNRVPYGTTVISVTSTSAVVMSNQATSSGTESVGFGNSPSFDNTQALCPPNVSNYRAGLFQNFGINNVGNFSSGTITGIKVRIRGEWLTLSGTDRGFYVSLNKGGTGGTFSAERWVLFSQARLVAGYLELGGQFDTWGVSWSPADFIDGAATFGVTLRKHSASVDLTHFIDGVEVTVYAGGNTVNLDGDPFKTIVLTDQIGNSFAVGAAGAAPVPTAGALVNGQMILVDSANGDLVGSLPDDIDAYPDTYRLPLQDRGNSIVAYGRGAVVGCVNSIKRLNYFPTEADADFRRGRAFEDIVTDHGCAGPEAMVTLDMPGKGTTVVYYSPAKGLHITDAVTSMPLNEDLDWGNLIEPTLAYKTILKNYPKLYLLALYYVPVGGTRRTKVMYFAYHPIHQKNDKLPAVGPVTCQSGSADSFLLNGASQLATGHGTDGKVYIEDSGTTDENSVAVGPTIRSRRFFASRPGDQGRIERLFLIADAAGDVTTGGFTAKIYRQNQDEALTLAHTIPDGVIDTVGQSTRFGGLIEVWNDDTVETFELDLTKSVAQTAALRLHYLLFEDARNYGQDNNN